MSSVFYRSAGQPYRQAVAADGMYIEDAGGSRYLDMSGGPAVSALGHAHPAVVAALHQQLDRLDYAHTAFFTHQPQERLAALLVAQFGDPGAQVYFSSGGSEANETAIKAAWQYHRARGEPQRQAIISREHSYHGNTLGSLSVSGNPGRRAASAAPLLDWPRIAPCYALRDQRAGESRGAYVERICAELDEAIIRLGPERVAAFICEPVVGSSLGAVPAEAGYLARIRAICRRHGVLLIADEVMCGSGRTGTFFAHQHDGIEVDIVTLGKGIGGGYVPLAATVFSSAVAGTLADAGFVHGYTYVAHPLACAAGVAVLETIERDSLLARTRDMGARLGGLLRERFGQHPCVGDIRGRGLLQALELVSNRDTLAGFATAGLATRLRLAALDAGLVVYPGEITVDGNCVPHILLAPPMIVAEEHFGQCLDALAGVLNQAWLRAG